MTSRRTSALIAIAAAMAVVIAGLEWGTYAAGGSDSYCYLNQAELFATGHVHDPQPLVVRAPWPDAIATALPPGHIPAPGGVPAIVPMCASGYSVLMAVARIAGGRAAMFWVVPLAGGLAVFCTFLLGIRVGSPLAGALAASLLAASPIFLHQIMQPMSDVPAAAAWSLALVLALRRDHTWRTLLMAGFAAGAAMTMRPNLAPLAIVVGLAAALEPPWRAATIARRLVAFGTGALPCVVAFLALQNAMYGGPFTSGYGNVAPLFATAHVAPNLRQYVGWLFETQTPAIVIALAAPLLVRQARRETIALLAFALATLAIYLPYEVFEGWWFLRFLLPAMPAVFVLASTALVMLVKPVSPARGVALALLTAVLGGVGLLRAIDHDVFRRRDFERRYRDTGAYVASRLPANALVITEDLGGAVRFYSGRPTVQWRGLDPAWLDRAVEAVAGMGFAPYLVLERSEVAPFRNRFDAQNQLGGVEWPPRADIDRAVVVYDISDRSRFLQGQRIDTEIIR